MEIVELNIDQLKPYKNNAKEHPESQIDEIMKSIELYGMNDPIGIWGVENTIVEGHGRLIALKRLGATSVPCIRLDHLTDKERKEYTLAHNKITMDSDFSCEMLKIELPELDLGWLFDIDLNDSGDDGYYGDERERTYNSTNLREYDDSRVAGAFDMPIIRKTNHKPKDLMSFNYMLTTDDFDKGIHFYIDDYQFERIWNAPDKYMDRLRMFDCVLSPDFSLYMDMPLAMQIWNIYRSRLIGQKMQDEGIIVIPTLSWSDERSYDFCFDGLEQHGTVSVSTIGVKRDEDAAEIWVAGMDEAIRRLEPKCVIVYGGDIGYEFPCETIYIANHNSDRFKERDD